MEIYFTVGKLDVNMILQSREYLGIASYLWSHTVWTLQVTQSFQVVWACMQNEYFFLQSAAVDRLFSSVRFSRSHHKGGFILPQFSPLFWPLCSGIVQIFCPKSVPQLSGRVINLCAVISMIIKRPNRWCHPNHPDTHVCHRLHWEQILLNGQPASFPVYCRPLVQGGVYSQALSLFY